MNHLREVAPGEVGTAMLSSIEQCARQAGCNFTILEGLITGNVFVIMHREARPSAEAITAYEREEFAALPVPDDKQ